MPDKAHARNAKARAAQQQKAGNLSKNEKERVDRKADKVLDELGVVPIPSSVARFNKQVDEQGHQALRRVVTRVRRRHSCRASVGSDYRTPVNMFRRGDDYVFVMTYGRDADWVRNVDAAGKCDITTRGRTVHLVEPRHYTDSEHSDVPSVVGVVLGWIDVDDFMSMQRSLRATRRQGMRNGRTRGPRT